MKTTKIHEEQMNKWTNEQINKLTNEKRLYAQLFESDFIEIYEFIYFNLNKIQLNLMKLN
jgi:hypothetical protein